MRHQTTINDFFPKSRTPLPRKKDNRTGAGETTQTTPRYAVHTSDFTQQKNVRKNNSVIIAAVTEGRGIAKGEIGFAALDIRSSELFLSQFSDSSAHHSLIVKLHVLSPVEIVVPATAIEKCGEMRMLLKILREEFPNTLLTTIERKFFDAARGQELLDHHKIDECSSIRVDIREKYYCLACISGLFKYVEFIQNVMFAPSSIKVSYSRVEDTCTIDPATVKNLELIVSLKTKKGQGAAKQIEKSLLGILDDTKTVSGARKLRSAVLQPSSDKDVIEARLDAIEELISKDSEFVLIQSLVDKLIDVDNFPTLCSTISKGTDTHRIMENRVLQIIYLKVALELVEPLTEALSGFDNSLFATFREHMLKDKRFKEIQDEIEKILTPTGPGSARVGQNNRLNALEKMSQKCYAIRPGINGLLEMARRSFSELIADSHAHLEELKAETNLDFRLVFTAGKGFHLRLDLGATSKGPLVRGKLRIPPICISVVQTKNSLTCNTRSLLKYNDRLIPAIEEIMTLSNLVVTDFLGRIREKVSCLFNLSEVMAGLDLIVSLANYATITETVRPNFGISFWVKEGRHPLLEKLDPEERPRIIVPNDTYMAPESNFIIITGPNMAGKSTYLKQVALLQVMAQAGSFVPAQFASFRMCNQIFSRIGHNDNIEEDMSNFMIEMTDMKYILQHIGERSLLIIDELGRSTAMEEGLALCHALCEELIRKKAFIFFATHYLDLTRLDTMYHTVENYHFGMEKDPSEHLIVSHKLNRGHYDGPMYGLQIAKLSTLPQGCIEEASKIAEELRANWEEEISETEEVKAKRLVFRATQRLFKIADYVTKEKTDLATLTRYFQMARNDYKNPKEEKANAKIEDSSKEDSA